MIPTDDEYRDRALCAEQELTAIRRCVAEYQHWLSDPIRGRVVYRRDVVEHLQKILAP